ncbi:MAG: hypothetical protein GX250_01940 [Clostridiales bacterium]|nr:hypothetical protein [Clostridiales bacterium]
MDISPSYQLVEAALSIALGFALGIVYDLFRIMRRRLGALHLTALFDVLYWLLAAACLFFFGAGASQRGFRLFMFAFAFLGGAVYFLTLSSPSMWLLEKFADFLQFVVKCLCLPFVFTIKFLKFLKETSKRVFQYLKKWFRISNKGFLPSERFSVRSRYTKEERFEKQEGKHYYEAGRIGGDRLLDGDARLAQRKNRSGRGGKRGATQAGGGKKRAKRSA